MDWASIVLLAVVAITAFYYHYKRSYSYWKLKGVPYARPIPIIGNVWDILSGKQSPVEYFRKMYNEIKGPYLGFYVLQQPFLLVKDTDIIKRVLIKDFRSFPNRLFASDVNIDPISSYSLLGIQAAEWKSLRSKMSPFFSSGKIKMMMYLMKECGENLQTYIRSCLNKDVDVKEIAARYTTDVISTCAFGINSNCIANDNSEFRAIGKKLFNRSFLKSIGSMCYFMAPGLVKLFKLKFIDSEATDDLRKIFTNTVHHRRIGNFKRNDLIDILIELEDQDDKFEFNDDKLLAQAIFFFGGGFETTSSAIALTLHELCFNSDVQDTLRKEIKEVIEKHGEVTYEAVQDMKYLRMVVSETLRKYPLTPFVSRVCDEDYKIEETGLTIEKGTTIIIPVPGIHWDPKYFPHPEKYDPARFSEKNKRNIPACTYLPFGDGPRNCIGERFGLLSSKLGLLHILNNYKIVPAPTTKEILTFGPSGLLHTKGGIHLKFVAL